MNSSNVISPTIFATVWQGPLMPLLLTADDHHLLSVGFVTEETGRSPAREPEWREEQNHPILRAAVSQLAEYFAGRRSVFELPVKLAGTRFQTLVWQALCQIPYGETRSYKEIAEAVGRPKAVRAVGMANNRNPLSVVIPCHRVIGADGGLVGYASGLETKRALLVLEGALPG